jgi:hypothetical protein
LAGVTAETRTYDRSQIRFQVDGLCDADVIDGFHVTNNRFRLIASGLEKVAARRHDFRRRL